MRRLNRGKLSPTRIPETLVNTGITPRLDPMIPSGPGGRRFKSFSPIELKPRLRPTATGGRKRQSQESRGFPRPGAKGGGRRAQRASSMSAAPD
jgi:hypothetical protein